MALDPAARADVGDPAMCDMLSVQGERARREEGVP
jgi:hypothetical protein